MTAREVLIAKLREAKLFRIDGRDATMVWLTKDELERIIQDLEYADFSHRALEGGELPQTLKKQAS